MVLEEFQTTVFFLFLSDKMQFTRINKSQLGK